MFTRFGAITNVIDRMMDIEQQQWPRYARRKPLAAAAKTELQTCVACVSVMSSLMKTDTL